MCGGLEIGLGLSPPPVAVGSDRAHPQGVTNPLAAPQGGHTQKQLRTRSPISEQPARERPAPEIGCGRFHTRSIRVCIYSLYIPMHPYGSKMRAALHFTSEEGNIWKEVSSGAFPASCFCPLSLEPTASSHDKQPGGPRPCAKCQVSRMENSTWEDQMKGRFQFSVIEFRDYYHAEGTCSGSHAPLYTPSGPDRAACALGAREKAVRK